MDAKQLAHLKRVLKRRLGETEELLEHQVHTDTGELSSMDYNHPGDRATDLVMQTTEMAIEDGIYGHCKLCNKKIPYERLEALPTARVCIEHA